MERSVAIVLAAGQGSRMGGSVKKQFLRIGSYPVLFALDRSGLVGADGETHQGIFDIPYLSMIPNMAVLAPVNGKELREMLLYVLKDPKCPTAVKYSRGAAETLYEDQVEKIVWGKGQVLKEGKDAVILSVGNMLPEAVKAAARKTGVARI